MSRGTLRPADPADLITRSTAVTPDFQFTDTLWLKVLVDWVGDDPRELVYLQRLAGYILSGETKEQMLSLFVGSGEDGKSTFSDTLAFIMGDYATVATDTVFLGARFRQHSEELAMLKGARLVQLSEMSGYWDEGRIKQVTGGDAVTDVPPVFSARLSESFPAL